MVEVVFNGQSGNNLFQYFLGRCIAKEKGYHMEYRYSGRQQNTVDINKPNLYFNGIKLPKNITGKIVKNNVKIFKEHIFNWDSIKGESNIVLDGFFQNYSFYKNHKEFIKEEIYRYNDIFNFNEKPDKNDIVLHLRLNKYPWKTPPSFYKKILNKESYNKIWIVTDQVNHPYIKDITRDYKCNIVSKNSNYDFTFLVNANKIVMSQSTFCWWATFISKAKTIYYPIVDDRNKEGIWFSDPWINIDLFVDEERYKKILI